MRSNLEYFSNQGIEDILRNIRRNSIKHPEYSYNLIKNFKQFDKALSSEKSLWRTDIGSNKVKLTSKGLMYWPQTNVELTEEDHRTLIRITFLKAGFFWGICLSLAVAILFFVVLVISEKENGLQEGLMLLVFLLPIGLLPFLGRWLQNNTIRVIEYS